MSEAKANASWLRNVVGEIERPNVLSNGFKLSPHDIPRLNEIADALNELTRLRDLNAKLLAACETALASIEADHDELRENHLHGWINEELPKQLRAAIALAQEQA